MNLGTRMAVAWIAASFALGAMRVLLVYYYDIWSADGRILIPPEAHALIVTVQIAATGALAYLLFYGLRPRKPL